MAGAEGLTQSMQVIDRIARAGGGLSAPQREALAEIKSVFRIR